MQIKNAKIKVIKEAIRKSQLSKQNLLNAKKEFIKSIQNVNKTKTIINSAKIKEEKRKALMEKKRLLDIKNAVDKAVLQATINTRKEMSVKHQVDIERLMKVKNNEIIQLKKIDKMILDKTKEDNIKKMNKIITVYNSMRNALSSCKRSVFDLTAKKPVVVAAKKPVVLAAKKPVAVAAKKPVAVAAKKPVVLANKVAFTRGVPSKFTEHRQTLARQLALRRAAYAKFIAKYDDEDEDYDEDYDDDDEDEDDYE
jgi:NADH dehydrogenase/NADH:ubiquinone oxidoreductase subunit G